MNVDFLGTPVPRRLVVAGAGSIGLRHARLWRELTGVEVGVCDPNESALKAAGKELAGIETWQDFSDALAWGPDVVVVATPHALHADLTCQALQSGADVLCEKPMSMDHRSANRMAKAAAETRRLLKIGFVNRFHPGLRKLKGLGEEGSLGQMLTIRYTAGAYETLPNSRSRYQVDLPGALIMDYAHGIDLILWLSGRRPSGVYVRGIAGGNFPLSSSPNVCEVLFDYGDPFLASMQLDYAVAPVRASVDVIGDAATATVDLISGSFALRQRAENRTTNEIIPFERDDLFRDQIRDFLSARSGQPGIGCGAQEGVDSTVLMESVLASLAKQARISILD